MTDPATIEKIARKNCATCHETRRVMVGMSFPPNKTIAVKYEYEPCPECMPGPHSFHAKRTAQILQETRERHVHRNQGGDER